MKVKNLMAALAKCPPDAEVCFFTDWENRRPVSEVSPVDHDGNVLLGSDLPPEVYARDFKED